MSAVSTWAPSCTLSSVAKRAQMLRMIREFFHARDIVEVDTPILVKHGVTEPGISNINVVLNRDAMYLRTSPEYHMKRLLAAGSPDIYQIGKAFRGGEMGSHHQPEFTLIEWYRIGMTLPALYQECCELIVTLSDLANAKVSEITEHDYTTLFANHCELDPSTATPGQLQQVATHLLRDNLDDSLITSLGDSKQAWVDLLASHVIYPALTDGVLHVVTNYPSEQAMLARIKPGQGHLAERFEIFLNGIELANGFHELEDADEQARRFQNDREQRRLAELPDIDADPALLAALEHGLPDCCGVAVGLDRLIMALDQHADIATTMTFLPGS